MDRDAFDVLWHQRDVAVGARVFKSEALQNDGCKKSENTFAAQQHSCGFVCGKTKPAVTIHLFAGGSCMDLVPLFGLAKSTVCIVFDEVVGWIIETLKFPLVSVLRGEKCELQHELAQQMAENSAGHFCGTFGCVGGLATCSTSSWLKDIPDPGEFLCGKGFHVLEDVCVHNNGILEVSTSRSTASSSNSGNNNTTKISS